MPTEPTLGEALPAAPAPAPVSAPRSRALAARPLRPREMEDWLNHAIYHPLAWRLAILLARTPVTPNMVSVAGALLVVAAGLAYVTLAWPQSALIGMTLHLAWHVVDGADGDLARMTGRASPRGEMVDGLCDYGSHVVLYLLLGGLLAGSIGPIAWPVTVTAGALHAVQANHVEVQRRFYLHWIHGKPWLHHQAQETGRGPARWLVRLYLRLGSATGPQAAAIDRAVVAAAGDPARLERLRGVIREAFVPLLRVEKLLGPNQRAIVLGASMLATGSPLAYLAYGGLWLTAVLAVSIALHKRAYAAIAQSVAEPAPV